MKIRAYADLHLFYSRQDMERYWNTELRELIENLENDSPDMLVFCGDLCHIPYKNDDIRFIKTLQFMREVIEICRKKKIIFRQIRGTSTHDGEIITILKSVFQEDDLVRFYPNLTYEYFPKYDLTIRFLPEPYYDVYSKFKNDITQRPCDITFFHGTVDRCIPMLKQTDNVTNLPKSVLIKYEDIMEGNSMFVAGGHIHKHINIDDRFFYINSLTTHNFSDINNIKGYMEFEINPDKSFISKYISNYEAPKYLDFLIEDIHLKSKEEIKSIIGNIILAYDSKDKIRFNIKGLLTPEATSNVSYIQTLMRRYDIKVKFDYEEVEEVLDNDSYENEYFSDPSISIVSKIKKLMEIEYPEIQESEIKSMIK